MDTLWVIPDFYTLGAGRVDTIIHSDVCVTECTIWVGHINPRTQIVVQIVILYIGTFYIHIDWREQHTCVRLVVSEVGFSAPADRINILPNNKTKKICKIKETDAKLTSNNAKLLAKITSNCNNANA